MNREEYKNKLNQLTNQEFVKFCKDFGGESKIRKERVREFADNPKYERRICQLLNLKTEEEKITEAIIQSSESAKSSVKWAKVACVISISALIVSMFC